MPMRTHKPVSFFYRLQIYSLKLCLHRMFFFNSSRMFCMKTQLNNLFIANGNDFLSGC